MKKQGIENTRTRTRISRAFWEACGSPDLNDPLFVQCLFIGYGESAIRVALAGLDANVNDVYLTAEYMGFNEIDYKVIME